MKKLLLLAGLAFAVWHSHAQPNSNTINQLVNDFLVSSPTPALVGCAVKGEEIVWMHAYGMANAEQGMQATVDTPFMLASVSKTFTGMALMQLYDDGLFDLQDPVNEYLTNFQVIHPGHPEVVITFQHLLTHTAAIRDNWDVMPVCDGDCAQGLGDFMESYLDEGGQVYNADNNFYGYAPGEQYDYSNIGAALIGHLVEVLTGEDFDAYCESHLFAPLCMDNTHWFLSQFSDVSAVAVPYDTVFGDAEPVDHYGYPDYPDGQLRSSIRDVANWLLAFVNQGSFNFSQVVSSDTYALALSDQYGGDQGLIWYQAFYDGDECWGHNGGDVGVTTEIFVCPETQVGVAILTNGGEYFDELLEPIYQWAKQAEATGSGWPDCAAYVEDFTTTDIYVFPNPADDVWMAGVAEEDEAYK
ncbi:MAG: beta-lactamase family protein, partial [Flavobacteriales bacterium]|nr:beta-lactamase family protein [Flavobacteriales bacterium]